MKLYSVRELFELRRISSLKARVSLVRLFEYQGRAGMCDASGVVWPIALSGAVPSLAAQQEGCVFRVEMRPNTESSPKVSSPLDAILEVHVIDKAAGVMRAAWFLSLIPDPRTCPALLTLSPTAQATEFRRTPTSSRFSLLAQREEMLATVRSFFKSAGYNEFDPPVLVASGGVERYLNSFQTEYIDHRDHRTLMQLPTSPEFSLKKLVTEGCSKLFAMTHAFRNRGELARRHEPEFLMLEWYRIGESFESLMSETQALIEKLSTCASSSLSLPQGAWPRFRVHDLFLQLVGLDLSAMDDVHRFRHEARPKSPSIVDTDTWDDVFCKLFMELIEPFLAEQKACFVTHYPARMGALAALSENDQGFVDRFELYLNGIEICNGYRELVDGEEYSRRVAATRSERPELCEDPLFESCFAVGMYPCVGNALGLDRLIAVLLGQSTLNSVLPWPFASRFPSGSIALE